eukprot:CAMPEP_0204406958 /NCGR_PEP_ID=MMETSP0470-20130426/8415_1 /ASSEMBLY_ACC=CAM_ASM_000385 /TAXON_ID=2969 /ORGANISM="Oxyrrhis marina" /LENGTH=61 /DNA_ID=CAMNT_0051402575 /DNA_START=13 /DNA_END=195 /DNA_ORIENTATION=-
MALITISARLASMAVLPNRFFFRATARRIDWDCTNSMPSISNSGTWPKASFPEALSSANSS